MPHIGDIIAGHGVQENANGGIYISGATYGYEKKLEVAAAYHRGLEKNPPATIAAIARECKVGRKFIGKIVNELSANCRVIRLGEIEHESRGTKNTGFAATVVLRVDSISDGFLRSGHVLVLDNVRIHNGSENEALAEWLWMRFDIFVTWLPTRSPELNLIDLIWSYLVRKLQTYPLTILRMNM
jgi:hypothetical protein